MAEKAANAGRFSVRLLRGREAEHVRRRFDSVDDAAELSTHSAWTESVLEIRGADALRELAFVDDDDQVVGTLALECTRADWRSGSPGARVLRWPAADLGYGYRPRWLPRHASSEFAQGGWIDALAESHPQWHLELGRCAPEAVDVASSIVVQSPGPQVWCFDAPADADRWIAGMETRHRRSLRYYERRIGRSGGTWRDAVTADTIEDSLDQAFDLHRLRLQSKGKPSACLDPNNQRFIRALARRLADSALRLTIVDIDGVPAASCLSFVHGRRYSAFMSGWRAEFHKLDLGRQVIARQMQRELDAGSVDSLSLLGGDLHYKLELGYRGEPTVDLCHRPDRAAAMRQRVASGVIRAAKRIKRGVVARRDKVTPS